MSLRNLFHREEKEKNNSPCGSACGTGDKK